MDLVVGVVFWSHRLVVGDVTVEVVVPFKSSHRLARGLNWLLLLMFVLRLRMVSEDFEMFDLMVFQLSNTLVVEEIVFCFIAVEALGEQADY